MAWYRTGTVAVTSNSNVVTGTGTSWVDSTAIGETFLGPDAQVYEITSIVSGTSLRISPNYKGGTASAQSYAIMPTQGYLRDLAAQAAALVNSYQAVRDGAGQGKFQDGTLAAPGISFTNDQNTGMYRAGADDMRLVAGAADQAKVTSAGLVVQDAKLNITGSADATKVAKFEVDGFTTATTRTFTLPNANTALVGDDTVQTLTNKTINFASNTLTGVAPLASPALTGAPTAPTAADGTSTTQLATTAFVQGAVGGYLSKSSTGGTLVLTSIEASNPVISITGALTSNLIVEIPVTSRRMYSIYNTTTGAFTLTVKHTGLTSSVLVAQGKRNIVYSNGLGVYGAITDFDAIALTGVSTAATAAVGTNTAQIATTAFVNAEIANGTASKADKASTVLTPATSATPPANGDLVFVRTSNTSLTLRLKGTDGVVRSVALTLA